MSKTLAEMGAIIQCGDVRGISNISLREEIIKQLKSGEFDVNKFFDISEEDLK